MTVLTPGERGWEFVNPGRGATVDCFYCGEPVVRREVAVYWHGGTGEIYLHAQRSPNGGTPCALRFVLRLARDAWEADT